MNDDHDIAETMQNERLRMVQTQLVERGISDKAVLQAMATVPRHLFIPEELWSHAYEDRALPLPEGQTISQPFIVALMAEVLMLKEDDRVLDVGTGSGYAAAVMSLLSSQVYSMERIEPLAQAAHQRLTQLGYDNVHIIPGDGTSGLAEYAPYDAISVAAASPWVPLPLREQLADQGRLVIPVGGRSEQLLLRLTRKREAVHTERFGGVRFVPLLGEHSWKN
jgi:protein-L-isoaspartate(D-aspartate) O-methyltransferase